MNRNNDYKRMNSRVKSRYGLPKSNTTSKPADGLSTPAPVVHKRRAQIVCKTTASRCCYVSPERRDFTQSVGLNYSHLGSPEDDIARESSFQFQEIYRDTSQVASPLPKIATHNKSFLPETLKQLKELKRVICCDTPRVETSSQCAQDVSCDSSDTASHKYVETYDGTKWHNLEDIGEIDKLLKRNHDAASDIYISEVPRVRVIAEKFAKYKKNNVELRRLEERIVCVEYDVYDNKVSVSAPREQLRAFFIVQPLQAPTPGARGSNMNAIPSTVRHKFNISNMDLKKMEAEELEIIDAKISENKPYLENLKSLLKRQQIVHSKRNKNTLDLHLLYDIAKRDKTVVQDELSRDHVLSKNEFEEIKDYILNKTNSNITGITRRTLTTKETSGETPMNFSQIIANELL